jgi:hypothetical protein
LGGSCHGVVPRRKPIAVIKAHGDDVEFTSGRTIAKFADRGHEVLAVCATDKDKGLSGAKTSSVSAEWPCWPIWTGHGDCVPVDIQDHEYEWAAACPAKSRAQHRHPTSVAHRLNMTAVCGTVSIARFPGVFKRPGDT